MNELIKELETKKAEYKDNLDPNDDLTCGIIEGIDISLDTIQKFIDRRIVEYGRG